MQGGEAGAQVVLEQEALQAGFKSEVAKAQDMHHTTLNRESERLANDVAKVRSEIRCGQQEQCPCRMHDGCIVPSRHMPTNVHLRQHLVSSSCMCWHITTCHQSLDRSHVAACLSLCRSLSCRPCFRYEVEKLTASQRLDLNLEKGRMRDELQVITCIRLITG